MLRDLGETLARRMEDHEPTQANVGKVTTISTKVDSFK